MLKQRPGQLKTAFLLEQKIRNEGGVIWTSIFIVPGVSFLSEMPIGEAQCTMNMVTLCDGKNK